jgi:hypothetical protein
VGNQAGPAHEKQAPESWGLLKVKGRCRLLLGEAELAPVGLAEAGLVFLDLDLARYCRS